MPIYALGDLVPRIDPSAYVHPDAVVIGRVVLGPDTSVWPGAVLRGDGNEIVIGAGTNIQDGTAPPRFVVPPRTMALGVPVSIRDTPPDADNLRINTAGYIETARHYRTSLRRID
ncbi:gamma carbonic anhydrase family protein [Micromonospora craniellae]|uniref:Gamma carbonic anhydrase family protein n=1 Tax=Micromonospora craniellae TaxID=2294034 RepID=A0A372G2Y4_9ACTN|nr:hypothetical protein [Micromonospora craniellae]QOC92122.1 hypothetical protein ID554_30455 [Micromonospora craniellae]RFS47421.1 hypothetical protein D0Q02_05315 [Micromonospora craniellae]